MSPIRAYLSGGGQEVLSGGIDISRLSHHTPPEGMATMRTHDMMVNAPHVNHAPDMQQAYAHFMSYHVHQGFPHEQAYHMYMGEVCT